MAAADKNIIAGIVAFVSLACCKQIATADGGGGWQLLFAWEIHEIHTNQDEVECQESRVESREYHTSLAITI